MGVKRFRTRAIAAAIVATAVLLLGATPVRAAAAPPRDISKFACSPNLPNPFTDIAGSVHETAIRCGFQYGFFNGTSSTTFTPAANVTRGQYASFLARAIAYAGFDIDTSDHGFTDIANNVHRDAINFMANLGFVQGTSVTTFSPDAPINRGQAALIGGRIFQLDPNAPDAFVDDNGTIYEEAINSLAAVGLVSGVDSTHFDPLGTVSRGAAASFVMRGQDYADELRLSFPIGPSSSVLASLTGDNEVPGPGDANAVGTVELDSSSVPGMLCVTYDIDTPLSGDATAAHVHQGADGVAGPIVLTLPMPTAVANEPSLEQPFCQSVDPNVLDAIFANPSDYYVNIHTQDHPNGAIRGQLAAIDTEVAGVATGDQVVPGPGEANVFTPLFIDVMNDGTTLCSFLFYPGQGTPTTADIHHAGAGSTGPAVLTLPPFTDGQGSDGCVGGQDPSLLADIKANPADYYVNIASDTFPDGALRGQLAPHPFFKTNLTGAAEVPGPGSSDGSGEAFVDLLGGNVLCVALHVRGIDQPTAAHIHQAAPGVAGPIVVMLPTPIFNHSFGCDSIDPTLYDQIAANPGSFYVNVHTGAFPNGALRGQLAADQPAPASISAERLHAARRNS